MGKRKKFYNYVLLPSFFFFSNSSFLIYLFLRVVNSREYEVRSKINKKRERRGGGKAFYRSDVFFAFYSFSLCFPFFCVWSALRNRK